MLRSNEVTGVTVPPSDWWIQAKDGPVSRPWLWRPGPHPVRARLHSCAALAGSAALGRAGSREPDQEHRTAPDGRREPE
jgi:hypothetical protein